MAMAPVFPHLQPEAKERSDHTQHVKLHFTATSIHVLSTLQPLKTSDSTNQRVHDPKAYIAYSFQTSSPVLLPPVYG